MIVSGWTKADFKPVSIAVGTFLGPLVLTLIILLILLMDASTLVSEARRFKDNLSDCWNQKSDELPEDVERLPLMVRPYAGATSGTPFQPHPEDARSAVDEAAHDPHQETVPDTVDDVETISLSSYPETDHVTLSETDRDVSQAPSGRRPAKTSYDSIVVCV